MLGFRNQRSVIRNRETRPLRRDGSDFMPHRLSYVTVSCAGGITLCGDANLNVVSHFDLSYSLQVFVD